MSEKSAGHTCYERTYAECAEFLCGKIYAQSLGRHVIIPHGYEPSPVLGPYEPEQEIQDYCHYDKYYNCVCLWRKTRNTSGAVGVFAFVVQNGSYDNDKAQGNDGEIMSLEPQNGIADYESYHNSAGSADYESHNKGQVGVYEPFGKPGSACHFLGRRQGEERAYVGSDGHECRVTH